MADWVELRVHGVSGTPPEDMLGYPHVRQVAGDDLSRFFRAVDAEGRVVPGAQGHVVEGFHWGRHTSGAARQALWLLLIPFGLVNAAQFMLPRPHGQRGRWPHAVCGAALRLLAVTLTVTLLLGAAVILVDVGAWQWLGERPERPFGGGRSGPVAAAVVVVGIGGWLVSRLGRQAGDPSTKAPQGKPWVGAASDLARRGFYEGDPDAPALSWLHRAAMAAVLAHLAWAATATESPVAETPSVVAALFLGMAMFGTAILGDPEESARIDPRVAEENRKRRKRVSGWLAKTLCGLATVHAVAGVSWLTVTEVAGGPEGRRLPAVDGLATALVAVGVGAVTVLLGANLVLAIKTKDAAQPDPNEERRSRRAWGRFVGGMAASLVGAWGLWLGVGFTAGNTYLVERSLNAGDGPDVALPDVLTHVARAWGLAALLALLALLGVAVRTWWRGRTRFLRDARAAFRSPDGGDHLVPQRWLRRAARAASFARLKNYLPHFVTGSAVVGYVFAVVALVDMGSNGPLAVLGTAVLVFIQGRLLLLGWQAFRGANKRRGLAVLWDVIAFWPRAVHPFTPYPYSQRVVPDLVRRINWHLSHRGRRVVLAAHSQGSLIGVAALLWIDSADRNRVGFLTFGSQLRIAFSRAFPAYVNRNLLTELLSGLDRRWLNLYRDTDPIAGPVLSWCHDRDSARQPASVRLDEGTSRADVYGSDRVRRCGPEWRLPDPEPPPDGDVQRAALLPLRGHSNYPADRTWADALRVVLPAMTTTDPDGETAGGGPSGRPAPSVPDQQGHGKPGEQPVGGDPGDVGDRALAGEQVPPGAGG